MTKLFVYGINANVPKEVLEDEFSRCGEVTDVYNTGKGFAFVTMVDQDGVDKAIEKLHGKEIDGQEIKVEQARSREDRDSGNRSFNSRGYGGGGRYERDDRRDDRRGGGSGACYNCNRSGHMARDCPEGDRRDDSRGGNGFGSRGGGGGGRACYNCNQEGHMARECPQAKKQQHFQQQLGVPNFNMGLAGLLASMGGNNVMDRSRCIWVTGLPEEYQDADKLINIFGNFGNVRKVVFSEKKPDGALIEMDDPRAAWKCCACMNKMKLDGQEIKVAGTKIDNAMIKKEDTKSRDVRQAKENWRFSKDKEGKFRRIIMSRLRTLSSTVLVTNLPEGKSDQLKKNIIEAGYTVKSITEGSQRPDSKEKPSTGYTMVHVELASVEEAIAAVANLHNTWPKKFGTQKNDNFGNARGLVFSLTGTKKEKLAEKSKA